MTSTNLGFMGRCWRKYVYLLMWAQPFKEQQPEIKGSVLLRSVSKMGKMETRIVEKQGEIDGR